MRHPSLPEWRYIKTATIDQLKDTIATKENYLEVLKKELEAHRKELNKLENPRNSKLSILLFTTHKIDSEGNILDHGTRSFYYIVDLNKAVITTTALECTLDLSPVFTAKEFETPDREDDPPEEQQRRFEQRNRVFREAVSSIRSVIDGIFAKTDVKYWDELCSLIRKHYFR